MNDVYHIMNIRGVKEDNSQIVKILDGISKGKLDNDLRLLNYYQEIPVSYPGVVEDVEDDMVGLSVHQNQAVVMKIQKMTFLKSHHFPQDVVAKVFRADIKKSVAILSRFAYAQIRAERRQFVRVKLEGKIPVKFHSVAGDLVGRVEDISISGMCISGDAVDYLENRTPGLITIAQEELPLQIPAVLLKQVLEEGGTKYCFELQPDSKTENRISQFIFHRQIEIIRDLKESL